MSEKNIQIVANAVAARVLQPTDELKLQLVELLSYAVAGAEHMHRGNWDGRSTLFSYEKGTFPAGLLSLVVSFLQKNHYQVSVARKPAPEPLGVERPMVDDFGFSDEYAYQFETADRLVRYKQCIAMLATGSGKSRCALIAHARIKRPTLFVTTRSVLMYQMKRHFERALAYRAAHGEPGLASIRVGVMGDGEFRPTKTICMAMVQTIQAKLHDKNPDVQRRMREILQNYNLVILEEAHEASGNGYYDVLKLCTEAHYRLALTATPFMKEDEEANMRLMACSGPIAIRVSEKELIDKGILARPIFKYVQAPVVPEVSRTSNWQRAYHYGIVHNPGRNQLIAAEAQRAVQHGLSVMILVQRKEHGRMLKDLIATKGVNVRYIFGESEQDERDQCLKDLGSGKINVLIGSSILDIGVDVPSVGMVILAGAGKAEVALRQRIGRGLRRKPEGRANIAYVIDFSDPKNKHLVAHSKQRRAIVEGTPGFSEGILKPGIDFDYSQLETLK